MDNMPEEAGRRSGFCAKFSLGTARATVANVAVTGFEKEDGIVREWEGGESSRVLWRGKKRGKGWKTQRKWVFK